MEARLKLRPGQRGTKKLLAQYGDKLVCVRYRYDVQRQKRYKTVELIVDEIDWKPSTPEPQEIVVLRTEWNETELHQRIRQAGGKWDGKQALWRIRFELAQQLGLEKRVIRLKSL